MQLYAPGIKPLPTHHEQRISSPRTEVDQRMHSVQHRGRGPVRRARTAAL